MSMHVSADGFESLFREVSTWGRWSDHDQQGALHHLSPERIVAAVRLVRDGLSVTLSRPLATEAAVSNPQPAEHRMTMLTDTDIGSGSLRFTKDYVGADYHNEGHTHIDAFCHVAYDGSLYNGWPQDSVDADGASVDSIEVLKNGLVGRGVLLDIPRLRGVPWLDPGEHVSPAELAAAESEKGVAVN